MERMRGRATVLILAAVAAGCGGGGSAGGDTAAGDLGADVEVVSPEDIADTQGTGDLDPDRGGEATDAPGPDSTSPPSGWEVLDLAPPAALNAVFGVEETLFAVGDGGAILRNTGAGWGPMASPTEYPLYAVFGEAQDDVWAGGRYGTLLHWDGLTWTSEDTGLQGLEAVDIHGLWGQDGHLFAVGTGGTILHRIGEAWEQEMSNTDAELRVVWGTSLINVFVGTAEGSVLRNLGGAWTSTQVFGGAVALNGLHGTGMLHVVAVGGGGSIAVFDGETWAPKLSNDPYTRDLHGVWAFAEDNVWLAGGGGVIIRYEGSKWNLADVAGPYYKEKDWRGLWGRVTGGGGAELWTCGVDGAMLHYDGKDWKDAPSWPENDVHDVAGRQDGVAVAAGERGFLARWDGTRWITLASGTDQDLYGVTFLGDTALVVGDDGIMLEVDGDGVSPVETGLAGDLRAVCRGSDDALRVCGAGGLMAVQAEAGFQLIQTATVQDLFDCYCGSGGEVLAVGALGTALRHHAGDAAATAEAVPTAATLRRLDGPGFDDLVAVGDNGVAVRRTGGAWEKIRDESATFLYGVRWDGTTAVAVGWSGTVMWWDGETWTVEQLPSVGVLEQVWGLTPEHLVAVGKKGLFLRYLAPEDES